MPAASLRTPLGLLIVSEESDALVRIRWQTQADVTPPQALPPPTPLLEDALAQLRAYFDGRLRRFELPLRPAGTPFQQRVWARLLAIPYGSTAAYGALARDLDTGPRAVARACAGNPLPVVIPCHRVVGAGERLGGYSGGRGVETKQALLRLEGVALGAVPAPV